MRFLGLTITSKPVQEVLPPEGEQKAARGLQTVDNRGGWWGIIRESFQGAWQQAVEVRIDTVLTYSAVFRCISLISGDIAKCRLRLVRQDANGIWVETDSPSFSPVLRKPNRYQNRIQFIAHWVISKLISGNAYILKERDERGVVKALYVLNPDKVTPLVAEDGGVYYQLKRDDLAGVGDEVFAVPASEIIHDRWNTIYHPLVGTSPIYACGVAAVQGLNIQNNSANFFGNGARPSGVLTAPGVISPETAARLKTHWDSNYTGENAGKVAVLGDGLKFEAMAMKAVDAQLIDQLKWSAETVCSTFGVPAYKAGVGAAPAYNNIEALDRQYYGQCLQIHIESIELCLDEGLGLDAKKDGVVYGTEFDLDDLLRMDAATQVKTLSEGVIGGLYKPNEARRKLNLGPVEGGDAVYLQQQNYSVAALAKRDAQDDPFATNRPEPPPAPAPPADDDADESVARFMADLTRKFAEAPIHA